MNKSKVLTGLILSMAAGMAAAASSGSVDFSKGEEGFWGLQPLNGIGGSGIDTTLGNGAPALRTTMEHFGLEWGSSTNQAFLGDYGKLGSVKLALDVNTMQINYAGMDVTRDMVVELRDYDNKPENLPYTSVWYNLGTLDASKPGWQHLSVTIGDTMSALMPNGWHGYGAEKGFEQMLPEGRTFANVLSSVDEIIFTTITPGMMFGFSQHDIAIDNISISAVPEPATYGMLLGGLGIMGWMARRKRNAA